MFPYKMIQIANCTEDNCPKDWTDLEKSRESHLALCIVCFRKVTHVETIEDLKARTEIGEKAAIHNEKLKNQ